jgi:predicted RecB family nuclease
MTINGEKVRVPGCRAELIAGLRRMGISKVAGLALERVTKDQLVAAYCRERAQVVRRQQQERQRRERQVYHEIPAPPVELQLELFERR